MALLRIAGIAAVVLRSGVARASEPEPIRLTVEAPPACLVADDLLAEVERLGAHARIAREDERARRFVVTVAPDGERYSARLVVHDLVGRTTERSVTSPRCDESAKSVVLLMALALDEGGTTRAAPSSGADSPALSPAVWPAPATDDTAATGMRVVRRGRQGSGGLVVTGVAGRSPYPQGGMHVAGIRAYAAARVAGGTRVGASLAFLRETERDVYTDSAHYASDGWSGRAGAVIGWGAPWNDTVAGFLGEAGVAAGQQSGKATPGGSSWWCCYDTSRATDSSVRFVSPFVALSLVLQVPWKAAVRPVAGFTTTAVFGSERVATVSYTGELGVVWQAW